MTRVGSVACPRQLRTATFAVVAAALLAACAGPPPAVELKARAKKAAPLRLLVRAVRPERFATDDRAARLSLVARAAGGTEVAKFTLCDLYFKTAFAVVDELRHVGIDAAVDPEIWSRRYAAVAKAVEELDASAVAVHLTRLGAQEVVPALYELTPAQRRRLLTSRRVLLSAQAGLPLKVRADRPTGHRLRDLYFTGEKEPLRPLELTVEVLGAEAVAEDVSPDPGGAKAGSRRASVQLRFRVVRVGAPASPPVVDLTVSESAAVEGSGVTRKSDDYEVQLFPDGPLDRALRAAVRRLADALLATRAP